MNEPDIQEKLKELFIADMMEMIIPGVIHNLANPIGGITGRVQLMQARIARSFGKIESLHPEFYRESGLDKLSRDVGILVGESETLLAIFRHFEEKILSFSSHRQEPLFLQQMIEAEIKFADFYLDFKHGVKKTLDVEDNLPAIQGERAGYSLCLAGLINSARQRMQDAPEKELAVSARCDDDLLRIVFQDTGKAIPPSCCVCADGKDAVPDLQEIPASEHCLCCALMLLNRYGFQIEVSPAEGQNMIALRKPCKTA
jgi:signal transduction histidine kinase